MGAALIDGKEASARLKTAIAVSVAAMKARHGVVPGLATVLVGDDPASHVYVRSKQKTALAAGMNSFQHDLPATTSQADLLALIGRLNADPLVDGILVQLPLPKHIDQLAVITAIDPAKDVDGLHPVNAGQLVAGGAGLVPCTPMGCVMLIKDTVNDLAGRHAVVIGRSILVGKPVALLLLNENCTVTMAHSRTRDLAGVCRGADILVAAVGKPEMVKADWIKPGAVVIDVGTNRLPTSDGQGESKGRLVGDVDFAAASQVAGAISPSPGGVGPMTIACLMLNTLRAACRRRGLAGIAVPDRLPPRN
ncbi:MAG: bifunctional methylenetetrahydrofolate dehydrogenase/methenyltetrahydrofolate cyclohydrolase FolD [Rhodospirillaceae bacterium]|nr:bifunctional methylenetetrahydrofolate dehydrogenase/methenyltetrahydrofolate cyclohydrolase FolD [Rhodospirillaceae bacterium]